MTTGIVDTTVIIHLFRKLPAARAWIDTCGLRLLITPITWLEVMYGAPSKVAQAECKAILGRFDVAHHTFIDQEWAMQQMEQHRLSQGVSINDSLIASVAYRMQITLYTHNLKHMRVLLGDILPKKPY
jgi:predicted nucleic acid-binding protein